MAITGNKGEWSEIYALFKLLGDGKVHAGDANLNKLSVYYPILDIIRQESKRYEYKPDISKNIVIIDEDGQTFAKIPMNTFIEESKSLLDGIKAGTDRAFPIPTTEAFMKEIRCSKLKAPSDDKSDIHIVIHDLRTGMKPLLGFSIKSQLGSPATLLNATLATNITYKVSGIKWTDADIAAINDIKDHLPRMKAIIDKGSKLDYFDIEHNVFKNNLLFLDTCMPEFIAACLICDSIPNGTPYIAQAVKIVAKVNPFNFNGKDVEAFYAHKMKVLLLDAALGMTPAKEWTGKYDANGGYLVVKEDGDVICYHFYNRNEVEDYMYNNTRFERGSRTRHRFGQLYRGEDGEVYIKLNLQIRFKK